MCGVQVERQECVNVPSQQCNSVAVEKCQNVPKQVQLNYVSKWNDCDIFPVQVPRRDCKNISVEKCSVTPVSSSYQESSQLLYWTIFVEEELPEYPQEAVQVRGSREM